MINARTTRRQHSLPESVIASSEGLPTPELRGAENALHPSVGEIEAVSLLVVQVLTCRKSQKTSSHASVLAAPRRAECRGPGCGLRTADPLLAPGVTAQTAPEAPGPAGGSRARAARGPAIGRARRGAPRGGGGGGAGAARGRGEAGSSPCTPLGPAAVRGKPGAPAVGPLWNDRRADARLRRARCAGRWLRGGSAAAAGPPGGAEARRGR